MVRISLIIAACLATTFCAAQKIYKPYAAINTYLLVGDGDNNVAFNISGGYQFNKYKIGVGAGIDYHYFKTVPLFIEAQRLVTKKFTIIANGGLNIVALKNSEKRQRDWWNNYEYKYKNGYFLEGGIGYNFFSTKKMNALIAVLYSRKTITEQYEEWVYNGLNPVTHEHSTKYFLTRTALRLSIGF